MKHKDIAVLILGGVCIISGLSIFGTHYYLNASMQKQIEENVENSTIFVTASDDDSYAYPESESTLVDIEFEAVEALEEDQVIEEVKTYTNVLEIPELEIKAYINEGSGKAALSGGVAHHENTAAVGEIGNCVIAGHASVTYNCIFNRLEEIDVLDEIYAYDSSGKKHTYYVTQTFVCSPSNTGIITNTNQYYSMLTIYTCTNKGAQRFVVEAVEYDDLGLEAFKESLVDKYVQTMLSYNDSFSVENVTQELRVRSAVKTRIYHLSQAFKALYTDTISVKEGLYGVVLGETAFNNEHSYDDEYYVDFGLVLGGNGDDV